MRRILAAAIAVPAALLAQVTTSTTSSTSTSSSVQIGIAAGGGAAAARAMGMKFAPPAGQAGPVPGIPLSGSEIYSSVQVLADGTHVTNSSTGTFYRDSQGRMRSQDENRAVIFDPVAHTTSILDTSLKTYQQSPETAPAVWVFASQGGTSIWTTSAPLGTGDAGLAEIVRSGNRSPFQPVTEDLPARNVNGAWAKGSRVTIAMPAGTFGNDRDVKVVNERWYSDDLKVVVKSVNSDPRYGVTTYDLTNIVPGPPDPGLFQAPSDYQLKPGPETPIPGKSKQ